MTSTSLTFFQQFDSSVTAGTYASGSSEYTTLTSAVQSFADGFVEIIAKYTPSNGSLSEQYSKSDGSQLSAYDLTWSFASALTAFEARAGNTYGSWGAAGLTANCSGEATVAVTFTVDYDTVYGGEYLSSAVDNTQCNDDSCREPIHHRLCRCALGLVDELGADHVRRRLPDLE